MTVLMYIDQTATTTDTLQRFGETETADGTRYAEYNNLNSVNTTETLASCKKVKMGLKLPKDTSAGVVRCPIDFVMPIANRADGTPRFFSFKSVALIPVDATGNEKAEFRSNVSQLLGTGTSETGDLYGSFKTAI